MEGGLVLFLVLSTLIVFGFIATMRWLEIYKNQQSGAGGGENSLGTGELRGLIQEAMLETINPLEERLDRMEMSLRQLPEAHSESRQIEEPRPSERTRE